MDQSELRMPFVLAAHRQQQSFASLCARFGISRTTGYKWCARFTARKIEGLLDQSRRPRRSPQSYAPVWKERLRHWRKRFPHWGPKKLGVQLRRSHPRAARIPAPSTLGRWLQQMKLHSKRVRRAPKGPAVPAPHLTVPDRPNQVWSIDFKGWFRTGDGQRCDPLTVRDLYSRYVLGIRVLPNQAEAWRRQAFIDWFTQFGLPRLIRVDNGSPFASQGPLGLSRLSLWWLRLGLEVQFTRRAKPQ